MEGEMHIMFECNAGTHIRLVFRYGNLFELVLHGDLLRLCDNSHQIILAVFILDSTSFCKLYVFECVIYLAAFLNSMF